MPPRIRRPLQPGEVRRHEVVSEEDPDRIRLIGLIKLRDEWLKEKKPAPTRRVASVLRLLRGQPELDRSQTEAVFGIELDEAPAPSTSRFIVELHSYVLDNLGLCIDYVKKLEEKHVPEEDVIQESIAAFIDAFMRFDASKAGRISTFAMWRLRFETERLIQDKQGAVVKVPGDLRDDHDAAAKVADEHLLRFGSVTDETILSVLREREEKKNKDRVKAGKEPKRRWASAVPEDIRDARRTYVGCEYAELRVTDASEEVEPDTRLDLRRLVAKLPPRLRAALAVEHGLVIHESDLAYAAKDELMHETALKLATSLLSRWMQNGG